jgi:hypothetical protein
VQPDSVRRALARFALLAASTFLSLAALELGARHLDGYPLFAVRLPPGFPPATFDLTPRMPESLEAAAKTLPTDIETDPAWIGVDPPLINRAPIAPEFLDRRSRITDPGTDEFDLYHIWNRALVEERECTTLRQLARLPMPLDIFEPIEPGAAPPYRYYQSRTTPLGLTTNAFGFRGPVLPLNKAEGTVRIAFIGASTTVGSYGAPYSYPEYVVHWLNVWAQRSKRPVRFDVVNAGRTGMTSGNIAAIVRQEVLPLEPDLLVYYEGSNQFIFADHLAGEEYPVLGRPETILEAVERRLGPYSALVRRTSRGLKTLAGESAEPSKPRYQLRWPDGLDRERPDIERKDLPLDLSRITSDLRSIRDVASRQGAELAVSSFVFFVRDGLRISRTRGGFIYDWLNHFCWPYTYADLRMLADFQNTVFEELARKEQLLFVDVARHYPMDENWFFDAIHFSNDGIRLQAWIVFQSILPRIRERVESGTWPRPDRDDASAHPNLRGYRQMTLTCPR